jgi:hypothetical protein
MLPSLAKRLFILSSWKDKRNSEADSDQALIFAWQGRSRGGGCFRDFFVADRRPTRAIDYKVSMFDKLIAIVAWALLAMIAFATISPIQERPTLASSASFEHLAAFAVLGILFCLAYCRQFVLVCLIVIGSAVFLEYAQLLTPDRHGRVEDALEKIAGGTAGILIGRVIVYIARHKRFWK